MSGVALKPLGLTSWDATKIVAWVMAVSDIDAMIAHLEAESDRETDAQTSVAILTVRGMLYRRRDGWTAERLIEHAEKWGELFRK